MNYEKNIKEWVEWVHQSQWRMYKSNTSYPMIYKCKWGKQCSQRFCPHLHPHQRGYEQAPFYKNSMPCRYETSATSCKQKCPHDTGRYCPFRHCSHYLKPVMFCYRFHCQAHCPDCI